MSDFVMIDSNRMRNGISEGCFTALAARAGLSIERVPGESDYGVDYHIKKLININGKNRAGSIFLDVQLKSTTNYEVNGNVIKYNLKVKTYNDIVYRNISDEVPILLVLMLLNKDETQWCDICKNNVTFKNSLFWYQIKENSLLSTDPDSTKIINVPVDQILTVEKLSSLVHEYPY